VENYDEILNAYLPTIDQQVCEFLSKTIEDHEAKTNCLLLMYINLLANAIVKTSSPDKLSSNFEAMKKAVSFSFDEVFKMVEEDKNKEIH
jgi:hypothetical protein